MSKSVFTFTDPDGGKHIRVSRTRTYTHAILVRGALGWRIGSCVGRPDLVEARLEQWGKGSDKVIAVPAD